jgi:hypothetical protein
MEKGRDRERAGAIPAASSRQCEAHGGALVCREATTTEINDGGSELGVVAMAAARARISGGLG